MIIGHKTPKWSSSTDWSQNAKMIIEFLKVEASKIDSYAWFCDRGFEGSNVADFWVRPSHRSILVDLLLATILGTWETSYEPTKKLRKMLYLSSKKPQMGTFSILRDENRLLGGWGGAAQLWAGKKLCSSHPSKITHKKISDQAHPLHWENDTSRCAVFVGF